MPSGLMEGWGFPEASVRKIVTSIDVPLYLPKLFHPTGG